MEQNPLQLSPPVLQMSALIPYLENAYLSQYTLDAGEYGRLKSFRVDSLPFELQNDGETIIVRQWIGREGHVGAYPKNLKPNRLVIFLENDCRGDKITRVSIG